MSISKKVSVYNILNEIIEDTGLSDVMMQPTWIRWAIKADREVGAFHNYIFKKAKLPIENCMVTLPCDIVALLPGMGITESNDCTEAAIEASTENWTADSFARFQGQSIPGTGMVFLMDAGSTGNNHTNLCYNLVGDQIQLFDSAYNGMYLIVRYLGYELDCNGFPLIRESNSDACNYFVQLKMAEKSRWVRGGVMKIDKSDIRDLRYMYSFHIRKARGEAGEPTPEERKDMVTMINSPFVGIRNAQWIYNDRYFTN